MAKKETRVEHILSSLKNHPVVATGVVASIAIIGLATLKESLGKLMTPITPPVESVHNSTALEEIEVTRLLDEAQDLITGRPGETELRFRISLCARPPSDDARLELARRKIDEAIRREGLPSNHRAYFLLGMVYANKDKFEKALQVVDEALTAVPREATLVSLRGELLFQVNRIDEALPHFELAVKLDPENAEYISNLSCILHRLGELDRAQTLAEDAVRRDPSLVSGLINLGSILRDQGLMDQAVVYFGKACRLEPRNADAHGHLGYTLAAKGEFAEAVREYQAAIDLAPRCGQYFYNMGLIQRSLGREENAAQLIKRAEELGVKVALAP